MAPGHCLKRRTVYSLDWLCQVVDQLAYRPAVVKATLWLPRWWRCDLARLSMKLDDRWRVGRWADGGTPDTMCRACCRRASWIEIFYDDPELDEVDEEGQSLFRPAGGPVAICWWCYDSMPDGPVITSDDELERALHRAREGSISWTWRRKRS